MQFWREVVSACVQVKYDLVLPPVAQQLYCCPIILNVLDSDTLVTPQGRNWAVIVRPSRVKNITLKTNMKYIYIKKKKKL